MAGDDKNQSANLHNFLQKSLHAGQLYTLAEGLKLTEADLDAWFPTFLAQYEEDQQITIEKCRVLWTEDADDEREIHCGFPKSEADIKVLFESGRLDEELFEPKLTPAELRTISTAAKLDFTEGEHKDRENKPIKCLKCAGMGTCPGTCKVIIALYDRVTEYIGRGIHTNTKMMFDKASEVRKILHKYRTMMAKHIHPQLRDYFLSGRYKTWEDLKNAVRRAFNVKEEKVTIPDLFRKLKEVISAKRPVEQKMGKIIKMLNQIAIKDKKDFFYTADFEGDRIPMRHPENPRGSPLVNTLLSFIMWEQIPEANWDDIQTEFERRTDAGWSYKTWHTHRPTLYEIMDKQNGVGQNKICSIQESTTNTADDANTADDDINAVERGYPKMNNRRQFTPANQRRGNSQPKENRGPSLSMAERHKQNAAATQSKRNLCSHCTHYDPFKRAVYHPEGSGFGGMGKCCLFDKDGTERKDSYGRGVNDIAYEPIEVEGFVRAIMADVPLKDDDGADKNAESAAWNGSNPNDYCP